MPEKTKTGNKWPHSSYLFNIKNDNTYNDAFDKLIEFGKVFARESSKVFLIKHLDYENLKEAANREGIEIRVEDIKREYNDSLHKKEKTLFWKKLNDMQVKAEIRKAILLSFTIHGKQSSILFVNCGSNESPSPLRKYFSECIEEECINAFKYHILPPNTPPTTKRIRIDSDVGDDDEDGFTVFPSQECIGTKVYNMIAVKIKKMNHQSSDEKLKFVDVKCLILLPKQISIETQTKERVQQAVDYYSKKFSLSHPPDIQVARIVNSKNSKTIWANFIKSAENNPDVLHLVVHDECHHAAGKYQITSKFLGLDKNGDYHNEKCSNNLFTLMVSATPFNFFASKNLKDGDILKWNEHIPKNENNYQGLTAFQANGKIKSGYADPELVRKVKDKFSHLIVNAFPKEFLVVIADYVQAFGEYGTPINLKEPKSALKLCVQESVKACIEKRKLIVIRVARTNEGIRQTEVAKKILKYAIEGNKHIFRNKVEVLVNSERDKNEDSIQMSEENKEIALKSIRKRSGNNNISDLKDLQFSDVKNIPMIMIIIEQGRMGDTFPATCVCFDLRARFLRQVEDFTSLIQDIGRAFGYEKTVGNQTLHRPGVNFIIILHEAFAHIDPKSIKR